MGFNFSVHVAVILQSWKFH